MNTYRAFIITILFVISFMALVGFTSCIRQREHDFNCKVSANIETMIQDFNVSRETH